MDGDVGDDSGHYAPKRPILPGTVSVSTDNQTATFTPSATAELVYYLLRPANEVAFADLEGQACRRFESYFTTG